MIYTNILNAKKPACFIYDSSKKRIINGVTYFYVKCRLLDFNGQVFGEVLTALKIRIFYGIKRVNRLDAFSLKFYRQLKKIKEYFIRCGQ